MACTELCPCRWGKRFFTCFIFGLVILTSWKSCRFFWFVSTPNYIITVLQQSKSMLHTVYFGYNILILKLLKLGYFLFKLFCFKMHLGPKLNRGQIFLYFWLKLSYTVYWIVSCARILQPLFLLINYICQPYQGPAEASHVGPVHLLPGQQPLLPLATLHHFLRSRSAISLYKMFSSIEQKYLVFQWTYWFN